ncbi:20971_t:CDS:1 [Gigaspora rosea]|nr:20971_t:CDS:1 [Gigaspora rosea]
MISSINAIPTQLDKRTSDYKSCPKMEPLNVVTVPADLVPNTKTSFTMSGKFEGQFTYNTKVEVSIMDEYWNFIYGFHGEGCPFESCPYDANKGFSITVTADLKDLPKGYHIIVDIFLDYINEPNLPNACAWAQDDR